MKPADHAPNPAADMLRHEADLIEAGMRLQEQGLGLLLAEMQALAGMIPGAAALHTGPARSDAETEADFDNMPV